MKTTLLAAAAALAPSALARHATGKWHIESRSTTMTTAILDNFELFAQYAGAAYCNSGASAGSYVTCADDVCPDVEANGAVVTASFVGSSTDVSVFVATDPVEELIVVSFMGTHSLEDWLLDVDFFWSSVSGIVEGGYVHSGFKDQYSEAKSTVLAAVESAVSEYPSYSLVVTGHSLGAAVATITAAYLRVQGYPCNLWTFGSPRVGDATFADFVTNQAGSEYRCTHVDDPIPRLPPLLFGYRHTSPEYWFHTGSADTVNYTTSDAEICTGNANTQCNAGTSGLDLEAHQHYFEYINQCHGAFVWKRDTETTEEIEARLNAWQKQDLAYVKNSTAWAGNVTTTS